MRATTNLVLDVVIAAAFLVSANPSLVGLAIHEWFGLAFAAALVVHLVLHWEWIVAATRQVFAHRGGGRRLSYAVDAILFVTMTAAVLSGLLMSRHVLVSLGLPPQQTDHGWSEVHSFAANLSVALMGVHLGLNWNWIALNVPRLLARRRRSAADLAGPKQPTGVDASWPSAAR